MINNDTLLHLNGESVFVDDGMEPKGTLYGTIIYSSIASGKIVSIDFTDVLNSQGVVKVITWEDIPGENQIGSIIKDEPLFAKDEVHYIGQPIALIVSKTKFSGVIARKKAKIEYNEEKPVIDAREAYLKNQLIVPPRIFSLGDVNIGFESSDIVVEGTVNSGGQEHLYIETQGAFAFPLENGNIKVVSSTQGPTSVQRGISVVLGIPMNKIEVETVRLGGGFGGKEDQATPYAAMSALASYLLQKPVKLILSRADDMKITGKRHPYSSDYKIGLTSEGKIIAYEVTFYQNSGAAADLSTAILERTLFHCTNCYFIPNVKATGIAARTNLPPNTAFRGFGGPQGMFVIETAIWKAAEKLKKNPYDIQRLNIIQNGEQFSYGQVMKNSTACKCWSKLMDVLSNDDSKSNILNKLSGEIKEYNKANIMQKKGFALMPICFGISFTNTMLNQAAALVNVYTDGSVNVSTGAIEMGQGVNMKIRQIVAKTLSIGLNRIKSETTTTKTVINTSPTAASVGADINGKAAELACKNILLRLKEFIAKEYKVSSDEIEIQNEEVLINGSAIGLNWFQLVQKAYVKRINLASQAHYATPDIFFDSSVNKGNPFAYYSFGTAFIEATVDCLRGLYRINRVKIVHDFGKSINPVIDKGQAEGALMQGIGWMTMEELVYNENGKLLTDALSTYKVPDIHSIPLETEIVFLEDSPNINGVLQSKAIGEPPFMYGIAAYFAILNAIKEFNNNIPKIIEAPITPERTLLYLYGEQTV